MLDFDLPHLAKTKIYIFNGPNLNLLGSREPDIYGQSTLSHIEEECKNLTKTLGFSLIFRQTNHEGTLVDWVQELGLGNEKGQAGLIINPGAYTHTSIALSDAISAVEVPTIEVHLSNIFSREKFRQHSYISPLASGIICGLGNNGYILAIHAIANILKKNNE